MELQFRVYGKIARPVAEVFDAVYNPSKLSGYFTTGGASAPLVEGSTVTWDFADFPGAFPVQVRKVERDRLIELEWKAGDGDYTHQDPFRVRVARGRRDAGARQRRALAGEPAGARCLLRQLHGLDPYALRAQDVRGARR